MQRQQHTLAPLQRRLDRIAQPDANLFINHQPINNGFDRMPLLRIKFDPDAVGQFDHPLLIQTISKVIEACNRHGVVPGIQTRSVAMAREWVERGMRFVGVAAEYVLLMEKCREVMGALRVGQGVGQ